MKHPTFFDNQNRFAVLGLPGANQKVAGVIRKAADEAEKKDAEAFARRSHLLTHSLFKRPGTTCPNNSLNSSFVVVPKS